MTSYEAPAKLNLSLLVGTPRSDGLHPLESVVQTVEWCDLIDVEAGEGKDTLDVLGADLDPQENLVLEALDAARVGVDFGPLRVTLTKNIPVASGLGGGSSDAAAILLAVSEVSEIAVGDLRAPAMSIGADVPLFLVGGSLVMSGVGEVVEPLPPLTGFATAIVVPAFGLSTADVYRRWDEMEGPEGDVVADDLLPPGLRGGMPMRNDLLPAALSIEPRLGDFMADVKTEWGTAVCLTGSGSGCFGYFAGVDEARDAAAAVAGFARAAIGVGLRDRGVGAVRPNGG